MYVKVENEAQIESLAALADKIWNEHFGPLFEPGILKRLIKQVQSEEAISNQINNEGYSYYFIQDKKERVGYFAYKIYWREKELFLSKLYIVSNRRGIGLGRKVMEHLEGICKKHDLTRVTLTVFCKNTVAIKAYERLGFQNMGLIERNLGKDVKFKDYKMEKRI